MPSQAEVAAPPGAAPPRGSRRWRTLAAVALAAALVAVIALVPALRTVDISRLRGPIASLVRARTGRAIEFGHGPALRLSLRPTLVADDVSLANAAWGSRPTMVHVKRVEIAFRVLPLLLGRVAVDRAVLVSPEVFLETDRGGRGNWELGATGAGPPAAAPGGRSFLSHLRLGAVRVTDAVIAFGGRATRVLVPAIALSPARKAPGDLDLHGTVLLGARSVALAGTVGGDAISGGRPFAFHVTLDSPGATATITGSIARLPELRGVQADVTGESSDPRQLADLLGVHVPKLSPFRLTARVADEPDGIALDPVRAEIGRSAVAGKLTIVRSAPRTAIRGDLAASRIDLPELAGGGPPAAAPAKGAGAERVFPAAPLPLGVLRALDADVAVRVDTLQLRENVDARSFTARVTLADGALTVSPLAMAIGGGTVSGRLRLEAVAPPVLSAELSGRALGLEALLAVLGLRVRCTGGATDLTVSVRGSGASFHDWAASLAGSARVVVGKGKIEAATLGLGEDVLARVVAAVNPFHRRETSTELRCAVVNVPIEHGVVTLDRRVALETTTLDVMASGKADLGREALDVELRSRATQGLGVGLGSFAGAVTLRGPLLRPALALNPMRTAEATATTVGAAAVTGGLSIVAKRLWDRLFARSPCKAALRQEPGGEPPPATPRKRR